MTQKQIVIIGAGPCGLSAAIACQQAGLDPVIIEKENVVSAIYRYPTHQTFFSSSDNLEIGSVAFPTVERKPRRSEALAYYREVAVRYQLSIQTYERVTAVLKKQDGRFAVHTSKKSGENKAYDADFVIFATGYYDNPNKTDIPGEEQDHVFHYFHEAHPFFQEKVTIVGGKNSAVDAALELEKAGAEVTVLYRGEQLPDDVKPWIAPEFLSLARKGKINLVYDAHVTEIKKDVVSYITGGKAHEAPSDFVFLMTGYRPDHALLTASGVEIDETTGRPQFAPDSMETNVKNLFIAGVIAAGNDANEIFIENGRHHGPLIAEVIAGRAGGNL
ncbi:thioredoxin reductase (NADPH) [Salsuginibacillus halophilus]|uniref:Thioredoxin reductase (NADPH) n=1 Tax=Salsuginibacillus halophilus TaxID=517424 RepID=A0A2P8HW56_9BACI|nr:YpdA family putative bacillithiol disulfide reductase [Salsuginibacillus halophilus]PSL50467.1 thioredoxin reductase (NADPH) [Salsuginibacillus halophilus]